MSVVTPPTLPMARFAIGFASYATEVRSPYTGVSEIFRPAVGGWRGTVGWSTKAIDRATAQANKRFMQRFHVELGGVNNDVSIPLPADYIPALADGTTATLTSLTTTAAGLVADIALAGNGATTLARTDMINLDTRLYMIRAVSGTEYTLMPSVMPRSTSPALNVTAPVVRARLDAEEPAGRDGSNLEIVIYRWEELVTR